MSDVETWADYHGADVRFHRRLAADSGYAAVAAEMESVTQRLYRYYLPYPIEYLRGSNDEHRDSGRARRPRPRDGGRDHRRHIEVLHDTMFMSLIEKRGAGADDREPTELSDGEAGGRRRTARGRRRALGLLAMVDMGGVTRVKAMPVKRLAWAARAGTGAPANWVAAQSNGDFALRSRSAVPSATCA